MISQFAGSKPASGSVLTAQSLEFALDSLSPSLSAPPPLRRSLALSLLKINRGTWVAQSVKSLTSAQIMISQFVSSSPVSGSVLTAQSLEPALDSMSPSVSLLLLLLRALSLSLRKLINIKKRIDKIKTFCALKDTIQKVKR